ncbi:MAG TPA: glycoside hydrolase family 15 protein [Gemmatimonadales bacterium]|nr:glycoside hydrolase family 15 protein [Gemmatimonadales bacterium]
MKSLDLALIGNGTIGALVDHVGEIVWACFPRFDGDPMFCSLLRDGGSEGDFGLFAIDLVDLERSEQEYLANTPVLRTRLYDRHGGVVEITDFAPHFRHHGRTFCPMMLVRHAQRVAGSPRIRLRVRPAAHYGLERAPHTRGSNHVRYLGSDTVLRLTTDAPVTALLEEQPFFLQDAVTLLLGPDETVQGPVEEVRRHFQDETIAGWREWVRSLAIPFEWQDAVIRAAITLRLNVFEDTGAIVAALTTSIPEAAGSNRTWDYRFCWLRDAYFVVSALNSLGATRTMERYLSYILNVIAGTEGGLLRPLYSVSGRPVTDERPVDSLPGYRGIGPVRVGNDAHRQLQNDVYGAAILGAIHVYFDRRLVRQGDEELFHRLEVLGEHAARLYDQPDAGLWELRGTERVHTFSSVMCWAGCDRLARIAAQLGLADRATYWEGHAARIHRFISERCWNASKGSFVATVDGDALDASLLRLEELGFLSAGDSRFAGTVAAIERELRHGDFVYRYVEPDDFGTPENAFLICTFWYIEALAALGRRGEARVLFERVLACRNRHGLLAEHVDPLTGEQWGNFVQTYSMVGLIASASRLSVRWDEAL